MNTGTDALVVDFELDLDDLALLPRADLEALRDLLPAQEPLPALGRELRQRLERCLQMRGTSRLQL